MRVDVTRSGAVILGSQTACDGHEEGIPLRVVTHAHYDHLLGLERSLKECTSVVMTEATKELLEVLRGPHKLRSGNVVTLRYEEPLQIGDENVTLYYADHILGSAQVLVENSSGERLLYTGDFRYPGTPVIDADVLVMEATYGDPGQTRPFQGFVKSLLVSLVERSLQAGPVYIFGYHGKLQEVMQILFDAEIWTPFILPKRVLQVTKVCEKHGMRVGDYIPSDSEEARELIRRRQPYVAFYHMNSRSRVGVDATRIYVSGWEFERAVRRISDREYVVALSDHADFQGLMSYVKECKPKMVITDNYRVGSATALAKEIRRRLGIPAKPLPKPVR